MRVIIYGVGRNFRIFFGDIRDTSAWMRKNDISIVGVAKTNPDESKEYVMISDTIYKIKHIGDFSEDSYDYILVTTEQYFEDIKKYLMRQGISEDRVIPIKSFFDSIIYKTSEYKYRISIAAIIKNEGEYIEEWLQFHILMGIEHFYVYDNESSDNTAEILKEYEKIGLVTYIFWPGKGQQVPAYTNAIDRFKNESIYMAFIDADEFLFPVAENKLFDVVDHILNQHNSLKVSGENEAVAVGINWRTYGTSFHVNKSDDLVIKRFVFRMNANARHNLFIKSIYNPRAVTAVGAHYALYVPGYCSISENGSELPGPTFRDGKCQKLRINHYESKSEEEYIERRKKGDADALDQTIRETEEYIMDTLRLFRSAYNVKYDPILSKYSDLVEKAIKKFRGKL